MTSFTNEYNKLNAEQQAAVDQIDGPLLVLAGPGTGKTTLLTCRTASILERTDTLAENILCLTFTESAQKTMQNRLLNVIGQDAYRVHTHTFHSFGIWAMRTYPEYFGMQLRTKPADDVTRYQIFLYIFERLNHHDPLSSMNDGDYLYLPDVMVRISHLKQAGVTPEELRHICAEDEKWLDEFEQAISSNLANLKVVTAKSIDNFEALLQSLDSDPDSKLGKQAIAELELALDTARSGDKINTRPITAWKNNWLAKKRDGSFCAKYRKDLSKLKSLANIYERYQTMLQEKALVDYDDMLLRLLQVIADSPDFLAELQEKFLYIMVDEYQDTNGVQDKILEKLASSPVHGDEPNVMIVGDDDQAIYGFQGATSSNVLDFLERWPGTQIITLTQNYRSTPEIVALSRAVITQGEDRLENRYEYVNKELHTDNQPGAPVQLISGAIREDTRLQLAADIKTHIENGIKPDSIAVLSPKHRYLEELLPYLSDQNIEVSYERRQNVLHEPHIYELTLLARTIVYIADGDSAATNELMPQLLSFPWWGIAPKVLWALSLDSHKQRSSWLEIMEQSSNPELSAVANWLIGLAMEARTVPLEQMLDRLVGSDEQVSDTFNSPYKRYYFDPDQPKQKYLDLLSSLSTLRDHLRDYQGTDNLYLGDFVSYVELRNQANLPIVNEHSLSARKEAVNLMTAFRAKGQEFDIVYVLDGQQNVWANPRERLNLIRINSHIAAVPSGASADERLRIFYVALTRAAKQLQIITYKLDEKNNEVLPLGWLESDTVQAQLGRQELPPAEMNDRAHAAKLQWQDHVLPAGDLSWQAVLQESMQQYHMSPTHLNAFLDVSAGGPRAFLINQLLRFPHALGPNPSFGNAMHSLMQWLHTQKSLPNKTAAKKYFYKDIAGYHLGDIETAKQKVRGERTIDHLYAHKTMLFDGSKTVLTERDFASEAVVVDGMRLKGKLDVMSIDETSKEVIITDYKTGKPAYAWAKQTAKNYEALKLHKYRQQLLFYKLLIDHSRSYGGKLHTLEASIVFLEPATDSDELINLPLTYDRYELERLRQLMKIVWQKIITLDLPDTSHYSPDIAGVKQFEEDLLKEV